MTTTFEYCGKKFLMSGANLDEMPLDEYKMLGDWLIRTFVKNNPKVLHPEVFVSEAQRRFRSEKRDRERRRRREKRNKPTPPNPLHETSEKEHEQNGYGEFELAF